MIAVIIIMSRLLAVDSMAILFAMCWDLAVGLRKAKQRGEARTSYGVSRTATKLLTYFGAFGVGSCIDVLLHVGRSVVLFGIRQGVGIGYPDQLSQIRIYHAKFGNVRDFIPVRVGQTGYLYDRVSGQLFGNLGSGDFILGPDI